MDAMRVLKKMETRGPEARRHVAACVNETDLMNDCCGRH